VQVPLPRWTLRLTDPASAYMARSDPTGSAPRPALGHHKRRPPSGAVLRDTSSQDARIRELRGEGRALEQDFMSANAGLLERKAAELLASGSITITTTFGTVEGHIRRFRRGDHVIEVDHSRIDGRGYGSTRSRLTRRVGKEQTDAVVLRLASAIVRLGPDAAATQ
jgi:hypothetical protein